MAEGQVYVISAINDVSIYEKYLKPSLEKLINQINIVRLVDNSDPRYKSMFSKYQKTIFDLRPYDSNFGDNDIFLFVHEDVKIHDSLIFMKLQSLFSIKPNVGVVGMIGTKLFPAAGGWWLSDYKYHLGRLIQGKPGSNGEEVFEMSRGVGFSDNMVSVDGFCFAVRGTVLNTVSFDYQYYPGSYHFYDVDFCFSALENGWDIAVADILCEHKSEGPLGPEWYKNRDRFIEKWIKKGYTFPITKQSFRDKKNASNIRTIESDNEPKRINID